MSRINRTQAMFLQMLSECVEAELPVPEKLRLIGAARAESADTAGWVDAFLLDKINTLNRSVHNADANLQKVKAIIDRLTSPPLFAARFWALGTASGTAWIILEGRRKLVPVSLEVSPASLRLGDEVLVNGDGVLLRKSEFAGPLGGTTMTFERSLADSRLLLRNGNDVSVLHPVAALGAGALKPGDLLLADSAAGLALEKLDSDQGTEFLAQAVPDLPVESVGGQDRALQRLITALTLALSDNALAQRYGLSAQRLILMIGPPGTGKTLMAKVAAAHLQRLMGKRCRICVVKPGQFEDPYVGVTQRRIRECFKALRSSGDMGILFLDEIESIARTRGNAMGFHSDKFLAALLAELQGFDSDSGSPLAVIACTNRLGLLDPAVVERFEVQIPVDRPSMAAAREIFSIHLPASLPFHPNGDQAALTRRQLIERTVTRLYSPNGDNHIAKVRFRDGTERLIAARELASGRCFSMIARAACQAAAVRETQGGQSGMTVTDMDEATSDAITKLSTLLTRENIHHYIQMPQDKDVVAVEPIPRRVTHPHRYMTQS